MTKSDSIKSHLEELVKKHRALDEQITDLEHHYNITEEVRRLKTQKLWLKDEIHRITKQLENHVNGS